MNKLNYSNMSEVNKKHRSPNFTNDEIMLLLSIINKYKHVIESKKTDGYTWKEKELTWQEITNQFNAECPNRILRTKESLKKCFENKKKETRKSIAEERIQNLKTGGGINTSKAHDDSVQKLALSIINDKTVKGSNNRFDCDADLLLIDNELNEEESVEVFGNLNELNTESHINEILGKPVEVFENTKYNEITLCQVLNPNSLDTQKQMIENANVLTEESVENISVLNKDQQESVSLPDWRNYKPMHLKTPLHPKLKNMKNKDLSEKLPARRRPITTTLHSSNLSKQYSELGELKIELTKLQLEILKADTEKRREREEEEHKLKIQSLKLDILIKQATLKKIQCDYLNQD